MAAASRTDCGSQSERSLHVYRAVSSALVGSPEAVVIDEAHVFSLRLSEGL